MFKTQIMRRIFCFGEVVYDIIFRNERPVDARPGGAILNVAVSLGRLGLPVYFTGDLAGDRVGNIIRSFLGQNGVDTSWVNTYKDARSRLALAFLDEQSNADYSFYKIRINEPIRFRFPEPQSGDILIFGSYYGIKPEIRNPVHEFVDKARRHGALIIYDPNFRKSHLAMLGEVKPYILENIALSHITKGSDEDFMNILGTTDADSTLKRLSPLQPDLLVYTMNRHGAGLIAGNTRLHHDAPDIIPLSTVGAGDSFTAGIAWWLIKNNCHCKELNAAGPDDLNDMLNTATTFASEVCMSYDNYISPAFAQSVTK